MWSDIETSKDLLGYSIHASLLKDVVTNEKNLPITVGLYGDWGCGKSSILKILKEQLEEDSDCVVVYFDGWSFESFDDAKMALIQGIIDALEKNERFWEKVKDGTENLKTIFKELRRSISWMRLLKWGVTVGASAAAAVTGDVSLVIPALMELFHNNKGHLDSILTDENTEQLLKKTLLNNGEEKKYEAVREFRNKFEELIDKSRQGKIVVLIDDLDRCLPRHIIDNLEAIKLFLNVSKTAFVIAADRFIVANAIKSEYKDIIAAADKDENRPNLGDSYMEKFIQLPYNIPALSRKEVETYVTLLFCQSFLDENLFNSVQKDFSEFIKNKRFDQYGWTNIVDIVKSSKNQKELGEIVGFVTRFSKIIGQSLRWNPRLIKRFLNAYEIRTNLLEKSDIKEPKTKFALLKLMLIEQQYLDQFKQLNGWVMRTSSTPQELLEIEKFAQGDHSGDLEYKEWNHPDLLQLISDEPLFSSVDMKELFWVSRDNIIDEMSGISLIPPRIKAAFREAYNAQTDNILERIIDDKIAAMSVDDLKDFYELLNTQIITEPNDKRGYNIYYFCDRANIENAYTEMIKLFSRINVTGIPFSLGNKFSEILAKHNNDAELRSRLSSNQRLIKAIEKADHGNIA
ncbi:MAG: KAP family NTPase [Prevotella sp.]|nr:KAP family NTPase [Prevotella sp.]